MKKTDLLQALIEEDGCIEATPYVEAFKSFSAVVTACFGFNLDVDFEEKIIDFQTKFDFLPYKNVTPKMHAIFHHVPEFCIAHGTGLGIHSEQASEAVHSKFNQVWTRYKVSAVHPEYNAQLFRAVTEFNSDRI